MRKSILVIDDDLAIANEVCSLLNERGYDTYRANSTEEAFGMLVQKPVDLVLTDVLLAGAPGTHLRHLIKQIPKLHGVRVIYMTAYAPTSATDNAPLISKPFTGEQLESLIQQVMQAPPPAYRDEISV